MTEKEDRLRRIDVTWRGQTERLYACRGEDPGWWILYTPGDWKDAQTADWELFEGADGERLYFQGQPPMPATAWNWIDAAPTPEAADELEDRYKKELAEQEKEDADAPTV